MPSENIFSFFAFDWNWNWNWIGVIFGGTDRRSDRKVKMELELDRIDSERRIGSCPASFVPGRIIKGNKALPVTRGGCSGVVDPQSHLCENRAAVTKQSSLIQPSPGFDLFPLC